MPLCFYNHARLILYNPALLRMAQRRRPKRPAVTKAAFDCHTDRRAALFMPNLTLDGGLTPQRNNKPASRIG